MQFNFLKSKNGRMSWDERHTRAIFLPAAQLQLLVQGYSDQDPMSASFPSPPGAPSAPRLNTSISP